MSAAQVPSIIGLLEISKLGTIERMSHHVLSTVAKIRIKIVS